MNPENAIISPDQGGGGGAAALAVLLSPTPLRVACAQSFVAVAERGISCSFPFPVCSFPRPQQQKDCAQATLWVAYAECSLHSLP